MEWPRAEAVAIVASGPSLASVHSREFNIPGVVVIAVNGAIGWLKKADYWFTLDGSEANLVRANNKRPGTTYVMAVPEKTPIPRGVIRIDRIQGNLLGKARTPGGLAERHDGVHTGNSAFGALGLAYHMRPTKIGLFGVDGTQDRRITGGRPRTLAHLPPLFATATRPLSAAGIEVYNGSPKSRITCFPRMTPQEALACLQS